MAQTMTNDITEKVVNTAKRWENEHDVCDIDPLDVKIKADLDGTLREVIFVMTIGGPRIEVNVTKGTVTGSWGGDSHTTHIGGAGESLCDFFHTHYEDMWEMNT